MLPSPWPAIWIPPDPSNPASSVWKVGSGAPSAPKRANPGAAAGPGSGWPATPAEIPRDDHLAGGLPDESDRGSQRGGHGGESRIERAIGVQPREDAQRGAPGHRVPERTRDIDPSVGEKLDAVEGIHFPERLVIPTEVDPARPWVGVDEPHPDGGVLGEAIDDAGAEFAAHLAQVIARIGGGRSRQRERRGLGPGHGHERVQGGDAPDLGGTAAPLVTQRSETPRIHSERHRQRIRAVAEHGLRAARAERRLGAAGGDGVVAVQFPDAVGDEHVESGPDVLGAGRVEAEDAVGGTGDFDAVAAPPIGQRTTQVVADLDVERRGAVGNQVDRRGRFENREHGLNHRQQRLPRFGAPLVVDHDQAVLAGVVRVHRPEAERGGGGARDLDPVLGPLVPERRRAGHADLEAVHRRAGEGDAVDRFGDDRRRAGTFEDFHVGHAADDRARPVRDPHRVAALLREPQIREHQRRPGRPREVLLVSAPLVGERSRPGGLDRQRHGFTLEHVGDRDRLGHDRRGKPVPEHGRRAHGAPPPAGHDDVVGAERRGRDGRDVPHVAGRPPRIGSPSNRHW
jgi:hypothetical protein